MEPLRDPFELYDEACEEFYGESSRHRGKQQADKDEEYREEDDDADDDDGGGGGDRDDERTTTISSCFFHASYPFWHLLIKGEC